MISLYSLHPQVAYNGIDKLNNFAYFINPLPALGGRVPTPNSLGLLCKSVAAIFRHSCLFPRSEGRRTENEATQPPGGKANEARRKETRGGEDS